MWSATIPFRWCPKPKAPLDIHQDEVVTTSSSSSKPRRHSTTKKRQRRSRNQIDTSDKEQTPSSIIDDGPSSSATVNSHTEYSCNTLVCCHLRQRHASDKVASEHLPKATDDDDISVLLVSSRSRQSVVSEMCLRRVNGLVEAWWRFLLGVVFVLQVTGVRRFLARFSGRRRSFIPSFLRRHKSSPWRILALIVVYTSLISLVDGCSSRNTPKPRPPPTPATAAATTARPNITFLTYECPPAYAAWYCLNGATCFTVKIGDSLLYNCECSEGYMGPRCEYKDLDGSYLPSQRRILLETASIAGGATIAVLLVVVLALVAYVHYCRRQRKEEPPTPSPQLTAAQSTLTTTTDTVDGVTRMLTTRTTLNATPAPRRLPTFGTRWKTQNQQQQPAAVTRVELQQVTTLLGDASSSLLCIV